jgi:hypothetical protein
LERENARKVYRWLWWSPLLTVPTLIVLGTSELGYVICSGNYSVCDWNVAEKVTGLIAVLGSALWHLVLLFPVRNKESAFVRWHGRQALALAGLRTVVPLAFVLLFGLWLLTLLFIPILMGIWLFGTFWGENQAERGDCSLARWRGYEDELPGPEESEEDVEGLVEIIRFSRDEEARGRALMKLEKLGLVEDL